MTLDAKPGCREVFAALSAFVDGALPDSDCRRLEEHMQGCKPCLAYIESLKTTIRACGAYQVRGIPPPPPAVREALRRRLASIYAGGTKRRKR